MLLKLLSSICSLSVMTTRLLQGIWVCLSGLYAILLLSHFYPDRAKEVLNCHYSPCLPRQQNCCFLASQFPNYCPAERFSNLSKVSCIGRNWARFCCQCRVLRPQQFLVCSCLSFTIWCSVSDCVRYTELSVFSKLVCKTFELRTIIFRVLYSPLPL